MKSNFKYCNISSTIIIIINTVVISSLLYHPMYVHNFNACTVQLNLNLTLMCTIPTCYLWILARNSQNVCESFYYACECTRTIQLLSNLLASKIHKCKSCHEHKKRLKTSLDTNMPSIIYDFSNVHLLANHTCYYRIKLKETYLSVCYIFNKHRRYDLTDCTMYEQWFGHL